MRRLILTSILTLAGLDLAFGSLFFDEGPDPAIFPRQQIPIRFTHDYHVRKPDEAKGVAGEGLTCTFCHENVSGSKASEDRDIPGHGSCDSCHDEWIGDDDEPAPISECARCHADLAARADPSATSTTALPIAIPAPNVKFSHEAHVTKDIACVECHRNVPEKTLATRDDYPTMDRCVACHQERGASTACGTCHFTTKEGRVAMFYGKEKLEPKRYHSFAIHDARFMEDHAVPAQRNPSYCAECHAEKDCLACHDGVGRNARFHPGDWIAVHSLRGKKDDQRCQSCHRLQTFCYDCHLRSGVSSASAVTNGLPLGFTRRTIRQDGTGLPVGPHPMGPSWTGENAADRRSKNFHGFIAQRNIRSCVACHQEQFCIQCHGSIATGRGKGYNPHGPDGSGPRGSAASKHVARACLKCHDPNDVRWRE